jgi:hypothetical protein
MSSGGLLHCCRLCGATSYRRVIARDDAGAMRASALYQCSGCSVVFTDPKAWRCGDDDVSIAAPAAPPPPRRPDPPSAAPDFKTYGTVPPRDDPPC